VFFDVRFRDGRFGLGLRAFELVFFFRALFGPWRGPAARGEAERGCEREECAPLPRPREADAM